MQFSQVRQFLVALPCFGTAFELATSQFRGEWHSYRHEFRDLEKWNCD
jgi:hypothetical protein